ncbi:uncharacterized protein LOC121735018 [Aricia agestis]|uniref:uncharacterized protein LOC121735018 n=1 Tax=Aricia agestis TaxID=91739 RepID=UPI001C2064EB|nr:uncharacterized protein LOC121735018 [Aricia agestis]
MSHWLIALLLVSGSFNSIFCVTRQQLKNTGKLMKKNCMPKNDVTEEQVGDIEKGKFIEERNVMCYVACVYTMTGVVKNNRLNNEAVTKQVDILFPPEMRDAVKAAADHCKDIGKKNKDLCEASYYTAKCMYEYDAENFTMSRIVFLLIFAAILYGSNALTKQQLKNSLKMIKKQCMSKNDVTDDLVGDIDKGKFIEQKPVMCYIACIYQMTQVIKNNKLNYESTLKQIDLMYPPELRGPVKEALEKCKDVATKYKDVCEASFWTAKCVYDTDPKNFIFA